MFICQFFGELKGLQIQGNFPLISTRNRRRKLGDVSAWKFPKSFSAAYNKWSMLIKPPVRHPGNFIGDARKVPEFWYIFSNRGYTVDCSLDFPVFGGIKCMPPPNLPLLHLHALEMHHSFMNNTCLGSELINMGMHILRTNVFCISSLNLVFNPAH